MADTTTLEEQVDEPPSNPSGSAPSARAPTGASATTSWTDEDAS